MFIQQLQKKFKYLRSGKMMSFIEQCVDFPNNANDDAPDCLARGNQNNNQKL